MSLTSNGLFNVMNRFGYHKSRLLSYSSDYADRSKVDCYIPTRKEVYELPIAELQPIVANWFQNAPVELVPSEQQKKAVIALLRIRHDHAAIAENIQAIERY